MTVTGLSIGMRMARVWHAWGMGRYGKAWPSYGYGYRYGGGSGAGFLGMGGYDGLPCCVNVNCVATDRAVPKRMAIPRNVQVPTRPCKWVGIHHRERERKEGAKGGFGGAAVSVLSPTLS